MLNEVFNDEVGWSMPANSEKSDQIAKTLHSSYVFLKEKFIRSKTGIDKALRLSQFFDDYKEYCQHHTLKACDKFDFVKRLNKRKQDYL